MSAYSRERHSELSGSSSAGGSQRSMMLWIFPPIRTTHQILALSVGLPCSSPSMEIF